MNTLFPHANIFRSLLSFAGSGVKFNSTEERSSRRREQAGLAESAGNSVHEGFRQLDPDG
jgi:hypothetical protein